MSSKYNIRDGEYTTYIFQSSEINNYMAIQNMFSPFRYIFVRV